MKPEDLERAVARGEVAPLYFIYGEEEFLVERLVQRLLDKIVSADFKDFNFSVFYGKESRAEQIVDSAMTLPMFAQRRVILVKRADEMSADAFEQMLSYLQNPSPDSCIVFQGAKADQRRKFFLELKKADLLVEFKKMKDDQLAGFIRRETEQCGKKIDPAAAEMIVYYTGNNLRELVAQLDKLASYCGERSTITADDVRAMASDTKIDSVFELAEAMGRRNLARAMRQLQTVLRDTDAPYMLIGALARHFRQLCMVRGLMQKKLSSDEIGRQAKINPYFLKGVLEQARNFRLDEFTGIFSQLHNADVELKSGGRQQTLLEMLVFSICGSR
jgi:DNA polymerase-3 subunit delta